MAQPINNLQAALAVGQRVMTSGYYPSYGGDPTYGAGGIPMGAIRAFAGQSHLADSSPAATGQIQSIQTNSALYSLLSNTYGGDGASTFGLPDLQGKTIIGAGQAAGGASHAIGSNTAGTADVTLTTANLPLAQGGQGTAFENDSPALTLRYIISTGGTFPSSSSGSGPNMMGAVLPFAASRAEAPDGFMFAEGQALSIAGNQALFSLLGTTYGGDGQTYFNLPDLRGRAIVGAGAGNALGATGGTEQVSVQTANLPASSGGSGAAIDNRGPFLTLNYLIATEGIYPSQGDELQSLDATFGEIIAFAGTTAAIPKGWALMNGSTINISQNVPLFSIIGTTFGGNGQSNFALPNAVGRVLMGTGGGYTLGQALGANSLVLTALQVPGVPPELDLNGAEAGAASLAYVEDSGPALLAPLATLTDQDSAYLSSLTVQVGNAMATDQLSVRHEGSGAGQIGVSGTTISYGGQAIGSVSGGANGALLTFSFSGALATPGAVQAALRLVQYETTSDTPSTTPRTVTVTVTDPSATQATAGLTLTITPANDAPQLGGLAANASAVELVAITPLSNLTVTDPDSTGLASATVTLASAGAADSLGLTGVPASMGNIAGSYDSATGVLSLTSAGGTATPAQWQAALRAVTYLNSSTTPVTTPRNLTVVISDGSASSTAATTTLTVQDFDAAAQVNVASALSIDERATGRLLPNATLTDSDGGPAPTKVVITLSNLEQGDFYDYDGGFNGDIQASLNYVTNRIEMTSAGGATLADWQQQLRGFSFEHTSNTPGAGVRQITIQAFNGATGGTPTVANLTVNPINSLPVLGGSGPPVSTLEKFQIPVFGNLTISDVDNTRLASARVAITGGFQPGDTLFGLGGSYDATTGVHSFSDLRSIADYQTLLQAVQFGPQSSNPGSGTRTITLTVTDEAGGTSLAATNTVAVTPVNDAPVVSGVSGTVQATEQVQAAILSTFAVADPDNTTLAGATLQISGGYASGEDQLLFANQNGITGSWNGAGGQLTLSGSASLADYESAIRSIRYLNSSDAPSTAPRTVTGQVTDGAASSNGFSAQMAVTAVNDLPVLGGGGGQTAAEAKVAVAVAADLTVADPDSATLASATVSITGDFTGSEDALGFTDQNGVTGAYNPATGVLTLSGSASLADYQAALRSVTYTNGSSVPFPETRTISFTVNDGQGSSTAVVQTIKLPPLPPPTQTVPTTPETAPLVQSVSNFIATAGAVSLSSPKATSPTITLPDGSAVPSPAYADAQATQRVMTLLASGEITKAQAVTALTDITADTTGLAMQSYAFFTGKTPSAQGMTYLINSPGNQNDLTDAYYAQFSQENRYINMAVNLGRDGEGRTQFSADYGGLSFGDAVRKAYDVIIGNGNAAAAGINVDAAIDYITSQISYFEAIGGDPLGAKAAAIGYIMSAGMTAHVGAFYQATSQFVASGLDGQAKFGVDLIGAYGDQPPLGWFM